MPYCLPVLILLPPHIPISAVLHESYWYPEWLYISMLPPIPATSHHIAVSYRHLTRRTNVSISCLTHLLTFVSLHLVCYACVKLLVQENNVYYLMFLYKEIRKKLINQCNVIFPFTLNVYSPEGKYLVNFDFWRRVKQTWTLLNIH